MEYFRLLVLSSNERRQKRLVSRNATEEKLKKETISWIAWIAWRATLDTCLDTLLPTDDIVYLFRTSSEEYCKPDQLKLETS